MWALPEYLERKRALADAFREQLRDPGSAPTPLRAVVTVAAGSGVRPVRIREHAVVTDSGAALGGYGLGPTAPELLLGALASCLAHAFLLVAADRGARFEQLEVEVTGKLDYRGTMSVGDDAPVAPFDLAYTMRYAGEVDAALAAEIQQEVERTCPILMALRRPLAVAGRVERAGEAG